MKNRYIKEIIDKEWSMFQEIKALNKDAKCLQNKKQFTIVRLSQWSAYSEEILESYLEDIKLYEKNDRNIVLEKYAWMMESTDPERFENLKEFLNPLSEERELLIDSISLLNKYWYREIEKDYPNIALKSRKLTKADDSRANTSMETYIVGELRTYSEKTLEKILEYTLKLYKNKENLPLKIIKNQVELEMRT